MLAETKLMDFSHYVGEWLALDPATQEIVAHGSSLAEVESQAIAKGADRILEYVPESEGYLLGRVGSTSLRVLGFDGTKNQYAPAGRLPDSLILEFLI